MLGISVGDCTFVAVAAAIVAGAAGVPLMKASVVTVPVPL